MRVFAALFRVLALLSTLTLAQAQAPEPRTALVIGNAAYSFGPLTNPTNDAAAMGEALKHAGFDVKLETNADQAEMQKAITSFGEELKRRGGVGLFFFAGHGVQLAGENYLLPVGGHIAGEQDIQTGSITASTIVDAMSAARNGLNIVVLDACRTNPFNASGTRGLSRIDSNASLFVSYSTSPGAVALDGSGGNSPYTENLAHWISAPDLSIEETFKQTLKGVYQETAGRQTPWISSTFFGNFVFRPEPVTLARPPTQQQTAILEPSANPAQIRSAPLTLAGVYRASGTNPDGSRYRGMLALTQTRDEFDLVWWIGKDIFRGTGHLAGKMLVVEWGDEHPVIYSFGADGVLDGEWADGSAKDRLEPVALASAETAASPEGRYSVDGLNSAGGHYTGSVAITKQPPGYHVSWRVGKSSYQGDGMLKDNLLTVDWGGSTPIVYALGDDGRWRGLWDAGKSEETLTPDR